MLVDVGRTIIWPESLYPNFALTILVITAQDDVDNFAIFSEYLSLLVIV